MDTEILECLERIEDILSSEEYEYGDIRTVGGATNTYQLATPYNTECEYAVISVSCSSTGWAIVTQTQSPVIPALDGSVSYGLAGATDNNPLDGIVLNANSRPSQHWQPLARGRSLYIAVNAAAANCTYVSVAFRRRIDRSIPIAPNRDPKTHSQPRSRRHNRTFMEGFEAQYPHDKYEHEEIPESQDTAMNVENAPTPAQVVLAKLRNQHGGRR